MNAEIIGFSILLVGVFLVFAKIIRMKFSIFSKYFLPSSIIAGALMLFLGPEVLGRFLPGREYGLFNGNIIEILSSFPGLLISIIFASLFIGKKIPNIKKIWKVSGPQVSFGQTVAWGQYVFGILITAMILVPLFNISPMAGALIEIAFEGGHGTSAGLADTFAELGFAEGADLALGLATVGVLAGVILGVILINWGVRKNKTNYLKNPKDFDEAQLRGVVDMEKRQSAGMLSTTPESIEPLALHLGIIGIAIFIGYALLRGLILLEGVLWAGTGVVIMEYIPLFPLAMIGGVIVQLFLAKFDKPKLVDRQMINRIQGLALDFLIVSAMATLSLRVIGGNIEVFLILAATGIIWNVFAFLVIAPRIIPKNWFERGIGDFGQSMGMTAAGLMLIRIVDSKQDTRALEAFGYKQLLFEPIVGGGLMTAASVPLIFNFGLLTIFLISLTVMIFWLALGLIVFGKNKEESSTSDKN